MFDSQHGDLQIEFRVKPLGSEWVLDADAYSNTDEIMTPVIGYTEDVLPTLTYDNMKSDVETGLREELGLMKSYGFENETFHAGNLSYKGSPDNACVEFLMEDISRNLYEKLAEQTGLLAKMNCQNFTELENSGDEVALYVDVGRNGEINMIFTCGDSYEYNIDLTKSEQDYIRSVIETE